MSESPDPSESSGSPDPSESSGSPDPSESPRLGERGSRAAAADAVLDLMRAHRTVRQFQDVPVSDRLIERAVAAAQCAATSSWIQAYHLIQVTEPEARAELARLAGGQSQVELSGAFFVVCGDTRRHKLIAERASAPHIASTETFLLAAIDASLFAQNLSLAFEAQGLGVCCIGGLRNDLDGVDRVLEVPDGVLPLFGLAVGVPASDPGTRPRLAPHAVWSKDRYPSDDQVLAAIDEHDRRAARYYEARGAKAGRNWSGGVWRKFKAPLRLRVRGYYESKGASFD